MISTGRVVSAGIASVAVSFGLARYGYGLLLPEIRTTYHLSPAMLGLVATGSYAGFLAATATSPVLAARVGARGTVLTGLLLAVAGMLCAGLSGGPASLAVGLLVAGASPGLAFTPFSETVKREVKPSVRGRALSAISSGTGWGVAVAVPVAFAVGSAWRVAWLAFAALGLVTFAWVLRALPSGPAQPRQALPSLRARWFLCPRSGPLLLGAFLVGAGSSVYWTFAVDHVVQAGGATPGHARLLLVGVGLASIAGTSSADLVVRTGPRASIAAGGVLLATSLLLLGVAPGSWAAVMASAVLFGAAYNVLFAIQSLWAAVVFADRPTAGLAAISFVLAVGLLLGPVAAGALAGSIGMEAAFVAAAAIAALAGLLSPREPLVPAPAR